MTDSIAERQNSLLLIDRSEDMHRDSRSVK
jgi:hypothetical protein